MLENIKEQLKETVLDARSQEIINKMSLVFSKEIEKIITYAISDQIEAQINQVENIVKKQLEIKFEEWLKFQNFEAIVSNHLRDIKSELIKKLINQEIN